MLSFRSNRPAGTPDKWEASVVNSGLPLNDNAMFGMGTNRREKCMAYWLKAYACRAFGIPLKSSFNLKLFTITFLHHSSQSCYEARCVVNLHEWVAVVPSGQFDRRIKSGSIAGEAIFCQYQCPKLHQIGKTICFPCQIIACNCNHLKFIVAPLG